METTCCPAHGLARALMACNDKVSVDLGNGGGAAVSQAKG